MATAAALEEETLGEAEYKNRVDSLQQRRQELEQRKSELFQVCFFFLSFVCFLFDFFLLSSLQSN